MPESKLVAPKMGERVGSTQHPGVFEVVSVNSLMQTANLRPVGGGSVLPNISWAEILRNVAKK